MLWLKLFAVAAIIASLFAPIPLTTIAPVEVIARAPTTVASPIEGVVDKVHVAPNETVQPGQMLVSFVDTTLRNRYELAERELRVSEAAFRRASQAAFSDASARHDLAIRRTERDLKQAELSYAAELLERTEIKSEIPGIAIYEDREKLEGKPVAVGERILQISDPADSALRIDLPVSDAIVLTKGARVRVFLDRDPLTAIEAVVTHTAYNADVTGGGQLVYRVKARLVDTPSARPQIGSRGTAQVFGETVSLGFFLFRRPIAATRQYLGL